MPSYDDLLCSGAHLRLVRRDGWEYGEHLASTASVAVLALTRSDEVVLVEQRRTPVDILHLFRVRCGERIAAGGGVEDEQIRVRHVPLAELERSPLDGYEAVDWHIPAALQLARVRDSARMG